MNTQLDPHIKAAFDEIVTRTPDIGDTPNAELVPLTAARNRPSHRRIMLAAAAAVAVVGVAGTIAVQAERSRSDESVPATQPPATSHTATQSHSTDSTDSTVLTPEDESPIGSRWVDDTDAVAITELLVEADWWAGGTVTHAPSGGYETLEINVPRGSEADAAVDISRAVDEVAPAFAVTTRSVASSYQDLERIVAEVESAVSDSRMTLEPGSDSAEVLAIYRSEAGVSIGYSAADNSVVIASERASQATTTVTGSGVVVEVGPVISVEPG